jgi:glyoxylase-like metal-dependent hydrolase (beta-lactamase superfamily II)
MISAIAPGVWLFHDPSKSRVGVWMLVHGNEGLLVETPALVYTYDEIFQDIHRFCDDHQVTLRFITATHNHGDHFGGLFEFHEQFPTIPIVVNPAFFQKKSPHSLISSDKLFQNDLGEPSVIHHDVPLYCFDGEIFQVILGGELLFLIHAPKHSLSDTMIIFRGCMISGDWWWGKGDPNWNDIPHDLINQSINRLIMFSRDYSYYIHSIFSVHANEFRWNVDFVQLLESTRP